MQVVEKVGYIMVGTGFVSHKCAMWRHASLGKFWILDLLRSFLMQFWSKIGVKGTCKCSLYLTSKDCYYFSDEAW